MGSAITKRTPDYHHAALGIPGSRLGGAWGPMGVSGAPGKLGGLKDPVG